MKRTLIIGATALITAVFSIFYIVKGKPEVSAVNKNIHLEVYKMASYVAPVYSNTTASLEVSVVRVKNNTRDTVWKHAFAPTELKNYPEADKPLTQKISIPNVNDGKERLEVYYKVTYNSEGSILHSWNYTTIAQGQQNGNLSIHI